MFIKSFSGSTQRDALNSAKVELGEDFMILDMRKTPGSSGQTGQYVVTVSPAVDSVMNAKQPSAPKVPGPRFQRSLANSAGREKILGESEIAELFALRKQMRNLKARVRAGKHAPFEEPFKFCFGLLVEAGVPEQMAEALVQRTERRIAEDAFSAMIDMQDVTRSQAMEELKDQIRQLFIPQYSKSRRKQEVIAVVGPSGAGKTSLITKLAAHKGVYRERQAAIISTDIYRAGANAGLKSLGSIMSVPVIEIKNLDDIPRARKNLSDYDVILVDTPGRSPLGKGSLPELQTQLAVIEPTETLLVLSANMGIEELWLFLGLYQGLQPTGLVVTKLDETSRPGKVLGLADDPNLPLKYISTGQSVPHSLELDAGEAVIRHLPLSTRRD